MVNQPGISWGPERPCNARRVCNDEKGSSGWALIDYSVQPAVVVCFVPDVSYGRLLSESVILRLGAAVNGYGTEITPEMRDAIDTTP